MLPQLRLAICGGALLIALHLLAEYGLYVLIRYDTLTVAIVNQFQAVYDGPAANLHGRRAGRAALSAFSALEAWLRGDRRYARVGGGAARVAPLAPARTSWPLWMLLPAGDDGARGRAAAVTLMRWL